MLAYARLRRALSEYADPTFDELLRLCQDFGLVTEFHATVHGVRMCCVNQTFEIGVDEAEVLMQGLILGFFFGHSRDDLSLAQWNA